MNYCMIYFNAYDEEETMCVFTKLKQEIYDDYKNCSKYHMIEIYDYEKEN